METKKALEEAIANSSASDYDKGNILFLAEKLADEARINELEDMPTYYGFNDNQSKMLSERLESLTKKESNHAK